MLLTVKDKTGTIEAKIWDQSILNEELRPNTFMRFKGKITKFNDNLELHTKSCNTVDIKEIDPQDFLPSVKLRLPKLFISLILAVFWSTV